MRYRKRICIPNLCCHFQDKVTEEKVTFCLQPPFLFSDSCAIDCQRFWSIYREAYMVRNWSLPVTMSVTLEINLLRPVKKSCGASLVSQGWRIHLQCSRCRFNPWVKKIPWRREWLPIPVFLPEKSHGQRSLVGCSLWGCKRVGHDLVTKQQQLLYRVK